eukprot:2459975-Rhodomonas_salina.2
MMIRLRLAAHHHRVMAQPWLSLGASRHPGPNRAGISARATGSDLTQSASLAVRLLRLGPHLLSRNTSSRPPVVGSPTCTTTSLSTTSEDSRSSSPSSSSSH